MKYEIMLQGGFANQLFQLAHAIEHHPNKSGSKFIINNTFYNGYHREELISEFYTDNVDNTINFSRNLRWTKLFAKIWPKLFIVGEQDPFTKPNYTADLSSKNFIIQLGYFQNYISILKHRDYLFQAVRHLEIKTRKVMSDEVAIHIRRGDYVSNPNSSNYHGVPKDEFYTSAYDHIIKNYGILDFTVFSDDISYARKIFKGRFIKEFVIPNEVSDVVDFVYLTKFSRYIISNSSYSYISSLLNAELEFVIAPQKWTKMVKTEFTDLSHPKIKYILS